MCGRVGVKDGFVFWINAYNMLRIGGIMEYIMWHDMLKTYEVILTNPINYISEYVYLIRIFLFNNYLHAKLSATQSVQLAFRSAPVHLQLSAQTLKPPF